MERWGLRCAWAEVVRTVGGQREGGLPSGVDRPRAQAPTMGRGMLAYRPINLVLMMINSCSYNTNDLMFI